MSFLTPLNTVGTYLECNCSQWFYARVYSAWNLIIDASPFSSLLSAFTAVGVSFFLLAAKWKSHCELWEPFEPHSQKLQGEGKRDPIL